MLTTVRRGALAAMVLCTLLAGAACNSQNSLSGAVNPDAADAAAELKPIVDDGRYDEALRSLRSMVANAAERLGANIVEIVEGDAAEIELEPADKSARRIVTGFVLDDAGHRRSAPHADGLSVTSGSVTTDLVYCSIE